MQAALASLPPKLLALSSTAPIEAVTLQASELATRVDEVTGRIERATFTGKGDKGTVVGLYKDYVKRIVNVLQTTLGAGQAREEAPLPPMPTSRAHEAMRAWHVDVLRLEHASMADALSGRRLDVLKDCVQIAITGHDASGKQLDLRNAEGLSAWLPTLSASKGTCALLTAGPATGKTWLVSQVVMHSLGRALVPVVIKVEQLQMQLTEHAAAFAAAPNWVDAYLRARASPPLRDAACSDGAAAAAAADRRPRRGGRRACAHRERTSRRARAAGPHVLCTSRPAGLDEARFGAFHKLQLAPLSDAQQTASSPRAWGARGRAEALPARQGAARRRRARSVTANPLMLSMVASIAELRAGIDMPTTTAELYDVAASAMMSRAAGVGRDNNAAARHLFEAHADKQRIITTTHLEAALMRLGKGEAAVAELRDARAAGSAAARAPAPRRAAADASLPPVLPGVLRDARDLGGRRRVAKVRVGRVVGQRRAHGRAGGDRVRDQVCRGGGAGGRRQVRARRWRASGGACALSPRSCAKSCPPRGCQRRSRRRAASRRRPA